MDFTLTPVQQAFRDDVRALLADIIDDSVRERVQRTGAAHDAAMTRAMAARGWLRHVLPGPDGDPIALHLLFSEMEVAGAPYEALAVNILGAAVIEQIGTRHQRDSVVQPLLAGEANLCLGYSEPDAGSDLTAVTTTAIAEGDRWTINGQKLWTTMAQDSRWILLLTRTNPTEHPRRGSTMFLVPMDTPGIAVHAVHTMGGDRVNAVYLTQVQVDDSCRLGDVDGAWQVLSVALALERGVLGNAQHAVPLLRDFLAWVRDQRPDALVHMDPIVRDVIVEVAILNHVGSLLGLQAVLGAADGRTGGAAGSMVKVFVSEGYVRAANLLQELVGPPALLGRGAAGAAASGWIDHHVRHSPVTRIAGGTTEINRNTIAERHLGLPRSR
jgi:alkylation response protein AidB-like acyl-CoA dehydrogenase